MRRVLLGLICVAAAPLAARQTPSPQPQQPPLIFRSAATLVPIDVRVLDKKGNPVTDLKREDFTLVEDGVPQAIQHFSSHTLRPTAAIAAPPRSLTAAATAANATPSEAAAAVAAPDRRVFLIVLGRGRLQPPSKGVDAAIDFVRKRLLPQDEIAVIAFNRATDFTSDHESIARVLDRFKLRHEDIEAKLVHNFSFPGADPTEIPAHVQGAIDNVFGMAKGAGLRSIPTSIAETSQMARDLRDAEERRRDEMLRAPTAAIRAGDAAVVLATGGASDRRSAEISGLTFEQMVATSQMTMQDLGRIYAGIEYLRRIEGEKHLVYVAEHGLFLPAAESDGSIAAVANDARVSIDIIQTGGLAQLPGTALNMVGAGTPSRSMAQLFLVQSMREIATLTGGQLSVYDYASKAIDKIDRATTSQYLLGYYPANVNWDGKYRRVTIKVNRPGTTVLYRHGYYAKTPAAGYDQRRAVTYGRVTYAANFGGTIRDLRLSGKVGAARGAGRTIQLDLQIDPSNVVFTKREGVHTATLDVAVFLGDQVRDTIGQLWEQIDLRYSDEQLAQARRTGVSYTMRIPIASGDVKDVREVKVVVYDYTGDRLGSAILR